MSVGGYIFKSLKPLGDRVLIEKALPVRKSVGGIVLPDAAQSKTNWGTVKAVGPGIRGEDGKLIPLSVKPGDKVMISEWANVIKMNDKEYAMVKEEEIWGTLEVEEAPETKDKELKP